MIPRYDLGELQLRIVKSSEYQINTARAALLLMGRRLAKLLRGEMPVFLLDPRVLSAKTD